MKSLNFRITMKSAWANEWTCEGSLSKRLDDPSSAKADETCGVLPNICGHKMLGEGVRRHSLRVAIFKVEDATLETPMKPS